MYCQYGASTDFRARSRLAYRVFCSTSPSGHATLICEQPHRMARCTTDWVGNTELLSSVVVCESRAVGTLDGVVVSDVTHDPCPTRHRRCNGTTRSSGVCTGRESDGDFSRRDLGRRPFVTCKNWSSPHRPRERCTDCSDWRYWSNAAALVPTTQYHLRYAVSTRRITLIPAFQ